VRHNDRQRILVFRTHVDEMDIQSIDLSDELRQSIELRFHLPPVVVGRPVSGKCLNRRELHALRPIGHGLAFWPDGRLDAPAQFDEIRLRRGERERSDGGAVAFAGGHLQWRQADDHRGENDNSGSRCQELGQSV
jgi:hypothetical protein